VLSKQAEALRRQRLQLPSSVASSFKGIGSNQLSNQNALLDSSKRLQSEERLIAAVDYFRNGQSGLDDASGREFRGLFGDNGTGDDTWPEDFDGVSDVAVEPMVKKSSRVEAPWERPQNGVVSRR